MPTRLQAEAQLAEFGTQFRPEQLADLARGMADALNPDGTYTDEDRARGRGLSLGNQQPDGLSQLRGWLTPEAARHPGGSAGQTGRSRHVQSGRRKAVCGR